MTVKQVSEHLLCSPTKISRLESGQRSATLRDVRDLCVLYGITDETVKEHLALLARESRQRGWWRPYDVDPMLDTFIGLESAATAISDFQTATVPGLLQTREYAEAILGNWYPQNSTEETKRLVDVRMERQRILHSDDAPHYWAIMDEAVLRRDVGGPMVMRSQLEKIVATSELQSVTVQVVPFRAGAHPGMGSLFILLDFQEATIPSVVYVDGMVGQLFLEQPTDVTRYRRVFDTLRALALSPADSVDLVSTCAYQITRHLRSG